MILLGMLHIVLLLLAYTFYLFVTVKSFSGNIPDKVLATANTCYVIGFTLGLMWAEIAWGTYLNTDVKTILSVLLPLPFLAEQMFKTKRYYLPLAGTILLILNYTLPQLMNTIHVH